MIDNRNRHFEVAILCPTTGEWQEMIKHLAELAPYNAGLLPAKVGKIGKCSVVCCVTGKGQEETASALTQLIERARPRWVFLVGIAGGFPEQKVHRGDLVVAQTIHSFDYGKVTAAGFMRRPELDFNSDRVLLSWASFVTVESEFDWRTYILGERPVIADSSKPVAHNNCYIASSNKVVDNPDHVFYSAVKQAFPEIHAVEMEGSGAAASIRLEQSERAVGLLMLRGISDEPGVEGSGGSNQRIAWRSYAASVAAAFTKRLIESLPDQVFNESGQKDSQNEDFASGGHGVSHGPSSAEAEIPRKVTASSGIMPWPSHDVILRLHVHPKKKNSILLEVHFTRNMPSYQDTQGMSVEIPHRRSLINEIIGRVLEHWKLFLAGGGRSSSKSAVQAAGQQLLKCILGPFDGDSTIQDERLSGLRRLLADQKLKIRVITKDVYIPWDLMHIPGKGFIGVLHCIETGVSSKFSSLKDEEKRADLFDFGKIPFGLSLQIDHSVAKENEAFRSALGLYRSSDIKRIERPDIGSFENAIRHNASDQFIYFSFVHSIGRNLESSAEIRFVVGGSSFHAYELHDWLSKTSLPYRPLLFLNLNESGVAGERLRLIDQYQDFYRAFFSAGLSAIIGPEIPMPPALAADFIAMFSQELFKGRPPDATTQMTVGDCLWHTKQKLYSSGHLYGLLYSYYLVREIAFEEAVSSTKAPEPSRSIDDGRREGGTVI